MIVLAFLLRRVSSLLPAAVTVSSTAGAQQSDIEALRDRLDAGSYRALASLVDSARTAGLPTAPLISKAQEGLLKRASPTAIVSATHGLLIRLRQAREALGTAATAPELEAGASALRSGAISRHLIDLRASRGAQSVAVPLVVLADMLARGVPRDTAARAVQAMASANATDAAFNALRLSIERDISGGMSPAASAGMRYRAVLGRQP
jgi:hypothetical protein